MGSAPLLFTVAAMTAIGCSAPSSDGADETSNLSSNRVGLVDFEFDGAVVGADGASAQKAVTAQMFYLIGSLHGDRANARLDWLEITKPKVSNAGGDKKRFSYHAKVPVVWPKDKVAPETFPLK